MQHKKYSGYFKLTCAMLMYQNPASIAKKINNFPPPPALLPSPALLNNAEHEDGSVLQTLFSILITNADKQA